MQTKPMERYFFFGLLMATFVFTFFIFRPFWAVLVLGLCFAVVLEPIYARLKTYKLPNALASLMTVFIFVILICGPLLTVGIMIFNQSQDVYHTVTANGSIEPYIQKFNTSVEALLPPNMDFDIGQKVSELATSLSAGIAKIFATTVSAFFSFLLMLLVIFYILKDGAKWKRAIIVLSPLTDKDDEKIIERLSVAVNGVIKGYLLVALVQGTLMGFGLWLFGVPNPALWGVLAAIASMIPTIGTALVSVPAIIFLLIVGSTAQAVGLLIWAALAVGMVDNFLSPIIVGGKINIPSLMILFSVLGGISVLGPMGILIGPLAVSLLYTLISIYRHEFKQVIVSER